ncbi:MAG: hypothetical protein Q7I99_03920 [Acholeplasmataceae bacterium]|nr:hypothetical protein [Acholeplasmataceae bacterium]
MKRFYIFYSLFSVVFLSTIYFFTLIQGSQQRSMILFSELANEAYENKDMTPFIKYQSVAYNHLDSTILGDYQMESYQVIAYDNGVYINNFIIYVLPINEVLFAPAINDENDQTRGLILNNDTSDVILDTNLKKNDRIIALSYGINQLGFYYHYVDLIESDMDLNVSIYDYDGELIFSKVISYDFIAYSPDSGQMELGYTRAELEELLDLNNYVRSRLIQNITIFLVIDIFLGALVVFIVKKNRR